jgi:hypothetical protein
LVGLTDDGRLVVLLVFFVFFVFVLLILVVIVWVSWRQLVGDAPLVQLDEKAIEGVRDHVGSSVFLAGGERRWFSIHSTCSARMAQSRAIIS